ncbi:ubiquitin-conjugating enzyme [Blastocystis sp. subtype 4]|uniref:ubiquitin-conjugating enzyme n=1 Tax=Blastocystis sp. subtype 4 TaxID=944170 RepID=UPI000711BA89|nr:ubiquitin-conjugating enzyme [Blastocystis sp. subtype 4]KNB43359.1 ubiquitin-conjugating enzyme [Blastocystis sp. subtype 4]|eukprot:XP_014526802.1 ubiquitin-conjugating enzyme [Blastocystis sp. subtype 4]
MNKVTKELKKLEKDPLDFATLTLRDGTNIVDATMLGPEESPYDGGAFHLEISVPNNYPLVAPTVRFVTKIYHPLVDKDEGKFCNEAIAANWKAVSNLTTVLNTVYEMLQNYASCEMALDPDIGDEVRNNREAFEKTAAEWTEKYAC